MNDASGARLLAIAGRLRQDEPIGRVPRETAAVAVTIRALAKDGEVLLIKRADREGDPWSGDVALPGGRVEFADSSFKAAAEREAREEVGADLAGGGRFLGYMGTFQSRRRGIWVVPSVFLLSGSVAISTNREVSSHMWVMVQELLDPGNRSTFSLEIGGETRTFPSFRIRGYTVWGLTERVLTSLVEPLGDVRD